MKIEDAKIGMTVIGNDGAKIYNWTRTGVMGEITDIREEGDKDWIEVLVDGAPSSFLVNPEYFDIVKEYKNLVITKEVMLSLLNCTEDEVIYIKGDKYSPYKITEDGVIDRDGDYDSFMDFLERVADEEYMVGEEECVEMTLEQICKELGKNIKIIKGETK